VISVASCPRWPGDAKTRRVLRAGLLGRSLRCTIALSSLMLCVHHSGVRHHACNDDFSFLYNVFSSDTCNVDEKTRKLFSSS